MKARLGHTPVPWTTRETGDYCFKIFGHDGVQVMSSSWHSSLRNPYPLKREAEANAAFITRACNAYHAIKAALGTEEDDEALVEVARNAHRAEQELAVVKFREKSP